MRRICLLLALCLALSPACAESFLLPGFSPDAAADQAFTLSVTPIVHTVMPLDESRTAELNALLGHLRLEIAAEPVGADERWQEVRLLTDGQETLRLIQHETGSGTALSASVCPGRIWFSAGDALSLLLGSEPVGEDVYGIRPEHLNLPDEADTLLAAVLEECADSWVITNANENVKGFGRTTKRYRWTAAAQDAAAFGQRIAGLCPEGLLRAFLSGLTFSGKQSLNLLATAEGEILKLTYSGQCGPDAESLRKVTVTWRRKRGEDGVKDELSVTSPAVKGKNRDTVDFKRNGTVKDPTRELTASLKWEKRRDGAQTQTLTASLDAAVTRAEGADLLSGTCRAELKTGTDSTEGKEAEWSLTAVSAGSFSGSVTLRDRRDGHTVSDVTLTGSCKPSAAGGWAQAGEYLDLDRLDAGMLAAQRDELLNASAGALIRAFVLLPQEDTVYLSRELPAWQQIVDAASQHAGEPLEVE